MRKVFLICLWLCSVVIYSQKKEYQDGVYFTPVLEVAVTEGNYSGDIKIPNSVDIDGVQYRVTEIGEYAFRGSGITSIELPGTIKRIRQYGLAGCNFKSLKIPSMIQEIETYALLTPTLEWIEVDENNKLFSSVGGVLFDKSMSTLIHLPASLQKDVYVVPEDVVNIKTGAIFETFLQRIELPETIESIGSWNFSEIPNLHTIVVKAEVPPMAHNCFGSHDAIVYVPSGSIAAYEADEDWGKFTIRSLDELTPVNAVSVSKRKDGKKYNIHGIEVQDPHGIYIQDGLKFIKK